MPLSDYTPEQVTIQHKGKALATVRGLNLEDVAILVRAHLEDLQRIFALAKTINVDFMTRMAGDDFVMQLITEAPIVAGNIIALASDEIDAGKFARKLPMGLQVQVLFEVMRMTFEDVGGPKAFVVLVANMVNQQKQLPAGTLATTQ